MNNFFSAPLPIPAPRQSVRWLLAIWLLVASLSGALARDSAGPAELQAATLSANCVALPVDVTGVVLWINAERNELAIQSDTNVLWVKIDLSALPTLAPGRRVHLSGTGTAGGGCLDEAVVDNDGLHPPTEKSGAIFLKAGTHPLRVDCFNGLADFSLAVDYAGPGLPRQPIPASALFRGSPREGGRTNGLSPGLDFRCYQGNWDWLPPWRDAIPFKTGTVINFDLSVRTRPENVGLQFSGYLNIPRDGLYTFWTTSDDGSRLYVGQSPLSIEVVGDGPFPPAEHIQPGQKLAPGRDSFWATVEGTITGLHADRGRGLQMILSSGSGHLVIESDLEKLSAIGLFSRVRATGLCRSVPNIYGELDAGRLLVSEVSQIDVVSVPSPPTNIVVTSVAQLRRLSASGQRTGFLVRLGGTVLATGNSPGLFAFEDETGGTVVQMVGAEKKLSRGREIRISGSGVLERNTLLVCNAPVVEDDGIHLKQERTGAMFLTAGKHPIHLSWFNRIRASALSLYYQGPDLPRQPVPNTALSHPEFDAQGALRWAPGLIFENYEGDWQTVPNLSRLDPVRLGVTKNFDLSVAKRPMKTGLEFTGFIEIPREGQYFFTLASDDGSLLFLDEAAPQLELLGTNNLPDTFPIASRQVLESTQTTPWSQAEGTVNFASEREGALFLELNTGYGPVTVEVVDAAGASPLLLLGSRLKVEGFCQSARMPGGQSVAGAMVTPGMNQVRILEVAPSQWARFPLESLGRLAAVNVTADEEIITHVHGRLVGSAANGRCRLQDETGAVDLQLATLPEAGTSLVEVLGRLSRSETNVLLSCAVSRGYSAGAAAAPSPLPLLTSVRQVKQLSREQAQKGYPVKIRGVITLVRGNATGFIIQDDTSAIDVWWSPYSNTSQPRVGDYWEVEGETFAEFSPNIRTHQATRLGAGTLPEPIHPAWDQLLNGSLDTLYVELQGIVTAVDPDAIMLFMRDGKIRVLLSRVPPDLLKHRENSLVRIRGCVVPIRDETSHRVQVGQIRLSNVSINTDEPAPDDPFTAGLKRASELLLFDARAGSLQRVKVAGQVVHAGDGEIFLRDGDNTVRVLPQKRIQVLAGDLVEVVGFPLLGGPSPVLREALLRPAGRAPLPPELHLTNDSLFAKGHDGQLVSVEARLSGLSGNETEKLLELQSGNREFLARLDIRHQPPPELVPGSLLDVVGVYSEQSSGPGQPFTSFELLLNSPADVRVLELPPWWTLRRALFFSGGLVTLVLAALFWIVLLRRRVEERTTQLAAEIERREQMQRQSALEKERTRIAKDMHDQLGTSVTQVGLLAELTRRDASDAHKTDAHAHRISETAQELGRTLDEIVWAVNPKNDSLDRFCDYVAVQAQELFQLTDVLCRVDLPPEMPRYPLSAEVRHNLFLAAKEALNNVVRHAGAREVWVRFKWDAARFQLSIVDDGRGFNPLATSGQRNGLQNMKKRLEEAGGRITIASQPGRGTEVTLEIALAPEPELP